jgi:hypothetical protein
VRDLGIQSQELVLLMFSFSARNDSLELELRRRVDAEICTNSEKRAAE